MANNLGQHILKLLERADHVCPGYTAEADEPAAERTGPKEHIFVENVNVFKKSIVESANFLDPISSPNLKPTQISVRFNGVLKHPTILERLTKALQEDPTSDRFPLQSRHLSQDDDQALMALYAVSGTQRDRTHSLTRWWWLGMHGASRYRKAARFTNVVGSRHMALSTCHRPTPSHA